MKQNNYESESYVIAWLIIGVIASCLLSACVVVFWVLWLITKVVVK